MTDCYYLSFASDDAFLGACILEAASETLALAQATAAGCNPGGEVMMMGPFPASMIRPSHMGRLLTDMREIDAACAEAP